MSDTLPTPAAPKVVYYADGTPAPADVLLDAAQARVLGALVEKSVITPEYYPLTLNALINACNQTTSRDPVVSYDESIVLRALEGLRDQKVAITTTAESRTPKYRHKLTERFELSAAELAVLCLLLLRGPQTAGELRNRSGRLHEFATVDDVEQTLAALAAKSPQSIVTRLPRAPGTKESRHAHLLCGPVDAAAPAATAAVSSPAAVSSLSPVAPSAPSAPAPDRLAQLEAEVVALRSELATLRTEFATFRRQFE